METVEHEPNQEWLRWWECRKCESAWHLETGKLVMGRRRLPKEEMRLRRLALDAASSGSPLIPKRSARAKQATKASM